MSQVNGVVYAESIAPPSPANWLTAGYVNGRVKCNIDFYVGLGTELAGTTIAMGALLPAGAKVLLIEITSSVSIGSFTLSVGDLDLATRYATALTGPATAGVTLISGMISAANGPYVIGTNPAVPTETDTDAQILLTTAGATITSGAIIGCIVYFTTD
jgi:hypothetical protein